MPRDGHTLVSTIVVVSLTLAAAGARAEQLPVKAYTIENGLAHNRVKRIVQDSRGFLWFCTADGLSRFDGNQFTNYQMEDGLLAASINDVVETGAGSYWIATNSDGVFQFNPRAGTGTEGHGRAASRFTRFPVGDEPVTNRVNVLYRDPDGTLWAGTDGGLFALKGRHGEATFRAVALGIPSHPDIQVPIWAIVRDNAGSLWIATKYGLVRHRSDGRMEHVEVDPSPVDDNVPALIAARDGRIWIGHRSGLIAFNPEAVSTRIPPDARRYTTKDGLDSDIVIAMHQSADGRIWVKTFGPGLSEFDGSVFRTYGLGPRGGDAVGILSEDREGNLWVGTNAAGALKITKRGWTTYGEPEGLGSSVTSILENQAGELYVGSRTWLISRFQDGRFTTVRPRLPAAVTDASWRDINNVVQDRQGEWWFGTRSGLFRFAKPRRFEDLAGAQPRAVYTIRDGLAQDDVSRVFEDTRGDIWIASWVPAREVLVRWERATGTFHRYSEAEGLRPFTSVIALDEDGAGNVWIGLREGGLARYRDGRFTSVTSADGTPAGSINGIYRDDWGRIWAAGTRAGLYRIDHPEADRPAFVVYTTAEGLSANGALAVTGDADGRIYVGTARGVDRLDPGTGIVRHYSTATGLTGGEFKGALRDRRGVLWFCTTAGLSRFVPEEDEITEAPPVVISGLRIAGVPRRLSALGETTVSAPDLQPDQNSIQVEYFGIAFQTGEALHYQYKLEGADADWSSPSPQRTVNYANLAPGSYRFLVRSVGADGSPGRSPAAASFEILPPAWRRWWFLATAAALLTAAAATLAHARNKRVNALTESENRFRTLTETASDAIITIGEDNRIVLVNEAAEKVFGYSREEMVGAELTKLMPGSLRDTHKAGFARYMETGARRMSWAGIELPGLHKSGHEVPLEISFGEFTRNGRRFFTGIARDITERKRAEDALRRSREERLAELERVRKRIATDLHDDIGSSLTRISLLGEVARRRIGAGDASLADPLASIANLSRELVDTMSDIVWAINPNKDHVSDLSQRMRHFASDVLTARGIEFQFRTPDPGHDLTVGANVRRELFLVFKEAVNNLVRHSGCSRADLEFRAGPDGLVLVVGDNGHGFDTFGSDRHGHGLLSMRERTEGLGGTLEIISDSGHGTILVFTIPIGDPGQPGSTHEYAVTGREPKP